MQRQDFCTLAESYAGLGGNHRDYRKYIDLLAADVENESMKTGMRTMSSCALFVRGLWRKAGLKHKRLQSPYRLGLAVADVLEIAKDNQAWTPTEWGFSEMAEMLVKPPSPGDVFHIVTPGSNNDHVGIILEIEELNHTSAKVKCIDGGQGANGANISYTHREWKIDNDRKEIWIGARKLTGWVGHSFLFPQNE